MIIITLRIATSRYCLNCYSPPSFYCYLFLLIIYYYDLVYAFNYFWNFFFYFIILKQYYLIFFRSYLVYLKFKFYLNWNFLILNDVFQYFPYFMKKEVIIKFFIILIEYIFINFQFPSIINYSYFKMSYFNSNYDYQNNSI